MRGVSIHLGDVCRILNVPTGGWDHYVKFEWPPFENMASALAITKKFSNDPYLT